MSASSHDSPEMRGSDVPRHIAIIMDGNGRWAERRGLPRTAGHRQGVEAVRRTVRAAGEMGVEYLTLYSFSTENWNRPENEISELFSLLRMFIRRDLADLHKNNVRILIIGDRDRVPDDLLVLLDDARKLTGENTGQTLVIAFNYGSRAEITNTVREIAGKVSAGLVHLDDISDEMVSASLKTASVPDPDLLIRTSGEMRLSNFLLWQLAYTELVFMECLWPDFSRETLEEAIAIFNNRNRRFGGLVMETGS
ncbi:MAG: isoprenyl transferase [Pseudomonadota bacterium]